MGGVGRNRVAIPIRAALGHALDTLLIEASASTDDPLVFIETDEILSGGYFHGERGLNSGHMITQVLAAAPSAL